MAALRRLMIVAIPLVPLTFVTAGAQAADPVGGPYVINEGDPLVLDGSGVIVGPTAVFEWDVDNDGQFDDATGVTAAVPWSSLVTLGLGDGPHTGAVSLRITESSVVVFQDTTTLTINNVGSTASMNTIPAGIVATVPASFTFGATDPSATDTALGFTYLINWGDGSLVQTVTGGTSVVVPHTYPVGGPFVLTVTATDKDGGVAQGATSAVVVGAAPVADAGGPYTINEGEPLTLNGSATTAGATATYAWDVDNDGQFDDATGVNPTLTAAQLLALGLGDGPAGPITVTLQVTDGPATSTDTATLTITNVAPTATIVTIPGNIVAGGAGIATFGATDPSSADSAAGFAYSVNWGDLTPVQTVTGGATVNAMHTFASAGTFTASVTATDKDGATSPAVIAAIVVLPLVVADAGGPYNIAEGADLHLNAGPSVAGPTAIYAWDLDGDGQFDDASGTAPVLTPAALAPLGLADGPAGPRTISLQVTDGASVGTDTATFSITNVAPTATIDVLTSVVAGSPMTVKVGAIDPSPIDAAGTFQYRIDWNGDGVVDDVVSGPADPAVTHVYASASTVAIGVIAIDKDGSVSVLTVKTVTVAAAPTPTEALPAAGFDPSPLLAAASLLIAGGFVLIGGCHAARRRSAPLALAAGDLGLQRVQPLLPEAAQLVEPPVDFVDPARVDRVDAAGSIRADGRKAAVAQDAQVL